MNYLFLLLLLSEFVINPNGKSEVCILHEYMQRVLKVRPVYNFFECGEFLASEAARRPNPSHVLLPFASQRTPANPSARRS